MRDEIAMQGKTTRDGKAIAMARPSLTIVPQSGVGGGRPRPRKPSVPRVIAV